MTGRTPAERFLAQRLASRGNCYVYVLELVDQRFAVGYTECLSQRLHDHWRGDGSAWTKRYPPLRVLDIIRTTKESALGLEEAKTMELKLAYGWNSTRGGTWNAPHDHSPPGWFLASSDEHNDLIVYKNDHNYLRADSEGGSPDR